MNGQSSIYSDSEATLTWFSETVDFSYRHDTSEYVAEPLRVQEVIVLQINVVIVQQNAILMQELRRLRQLSHVLEPQTVKTLTRQQKS